MRSRTLSGLVCRFSIAAFLLSKVASLASLASSEPNLVAAFEKLQSDDISFQSAWATWETKGASWTGSATLSGTRSSIQYTPSDSDLIGVPQLRSENSNSLSAFFQQELNPKFQSEYSVSYYTGYTNYRSIWLDEFYRQQFEPVTGYRKADPHGYGASIGSRIEYIPANAILSIKLGYQFDEIAPAYEAAPFEDLKRGLSKVDTYFANVASENVVSERLKIKQQLSLTDSTSRSLRASYSIRAHFAPVASWVIKGELGRVEEASTFDSNHIGVAIERDLGERFTVGIVGRRYQDSGEISDPSILSTAAPNLDSRLVALTGSWRGERFAAHFLIGDFQSDYGPVPEISFQFENLYKDRSWDLIRCSGSITF